MDTIEVRIPVEGILVIEVPRGLETNMKTKRPDKRRVKLVRVKQKEEVDSYVPGKPYTLGKNLHGVVPVKPLRVVGVCVYEGCNNPCPTRGKWCTEHFVEVRRIATRTHVTAYRERLRKMRQGKLL